MDVTSHTTYYGPSASSHIPMHTSYDIGGTVYSNEEYTRSSSVEAEIQKLYVLVDIAREKFAFQEQTITDLRSRVAVLESQVAVNEAQFTALRNLYYKRFEE